MKFEARTIATLLSGTALAMAIGMGAVYAEDTNTQPKESGDGATMPEHPEGKGAAPSTGMGGALRDEAVQGHDPADSAGNSTQQSDQPQNMGGDTMDHGVENKEGGGM